MIANIYGSISKSCTCIKCITYGEDYYYHCFNSNFECVDTYYDGFEICNNLFDFDDWTNCMEGFVLNEKGECVEINE